MVLLKSSLLEPTPLRYLRVPVPVVVPLLLDVLELIPTRTPDEWWVLPQPDRPLPTQLMTLSLPGPSAGVMVLPSPRRVRSLPSELPQALLAQLQAPRAPPKVPVLFVSPYVLP